LDHVAYSVFMAVSLHRTARAGTSRHEGGFDA
jgi:hypothetical protein